jgi:hypothetical protein
MTCRELAARPTRELSLLRSGGRASTLPFRLNYKTTGAHLDWSMSSGDRSFRSNPSGQTTVVAFIGEERNGVFFNSSDDDKDADDD